MLIKRRKQTVCGIAINQSTFTSHVTVKQFMTFAVNKLLAIIYKRNNPITGVRYTRKRMEAPFLEKPKELQELQLKNNIIKGSSRILKEHFTKFLLIFMFISVNITFSCAGKFACFS